MSEGGGSSLVRRLIVFLDFRSPASVGSHPQTWGRSFCSSFSRVKSLEFSSNGATNLDKLLIGLWSHLPCREEFKFACTLQRQCLPKKLVRLFASSIKECVINRGPSWRGISSEQGTCRGLPSDPIIYFCPNVFMFCGCLCGAECIVPVSIRQK